MSVQAVESSPGLLVKENVASALRRAIMNGVVRRGQRVIEGTWARQLGAAQASVREAINLLIAEGFLVKDAGHSARVVNYKEQDVAQLYEVRSALEGLAAELACARRADLSRLEAAFERMSQEVSSGDMKALIQSDLDFHVSLMEASGNPVLAELGKKLLLPLFAFIQIEVLGSGQGPEAWFDDLPHHDLIIQVIREGNPSLSGQFVRHCVKRFVRSAFAVWQNVGGAVEAHQTGETHFSKERRRKGKSTHV